MFESHALIWDTPHKGTENEEIRIDPMLNRGSSGSITWCFSRYIWTSHLGHGLIPQPGPLWIWIYLGHAKDNRLVELWRALPESLAPIVFQISIHWRIVLVCSSTCCIKKPWANIIYILYMYYIYILVHDYIYEHYLFRALSTRFDWDQFSKLGIWLVA